MAATEPFPVPRGWTKTTRSSVLHAISLAFSALTRAWSSSATSRRRTIRLEVTFLEAAPMAVLLVGRGGHRPVLTTSVRVCLVQEDALVD